jgi:hypothetical protein
VVSDSHNIVVKQWFNEPNLVILQLPEYLITFLKLVILHWNFIALLGNDYLGFFMLIDFDIASVNNFTDVLLYWTVLRSARSIGREDWLTMGWLCMLALCHVVRISLVSFFLNIY